MIRLFRWIVSILVAGVILAGASFTLAALTPAADDPLFDATDITGVPWGRDFELRGHDGQEYSLADFNGKLVALYFGYTRCPDVCPTTMATLAQAVRLLGSDAAHVQGVFVTVDPRHDTPGVLRRYLSVFDPSFIGLYGDKPAIVRTAHEFHVVASRSAHSTPVFLFDRAGRLRLMVRPEATAESIAHDLRLLLAQPLRRGDRMRIEAGRTIMKGKQA